MIFCALLEHIRAWKVDGLMTDDTLLVVEAKVLPEVFSRVIEAKTLLAQGKAKSSSQAAQLAGISRSAFYKYRDSVFAYEDVSTQKIATISASLADEPGVLSAMLSILSGSGANILTINQNIPTDGVAPVAVSIRCDRLDRQPGALLEQIRSLSGVVWAKLI